MTERKVRVVTGGLLIVAVFALLVGAVLVLTPVTKWDTDCGSVLRPFADDPPPFCLDEFDQRNAPAVVAAGIAVAGTVSAVVVWRRSKRGSDAGP